MAEIGKETSPEVSSQKSSDAIRYGSRSERKKAERPSLARSARAAFSASRQTQSRVAVSAAVALSRPSITKNERPRSSPTTPGANRPSLRRRASGVIVMTVAMGIIGTFALPAYAFNPADGAVDHTTFVAPSVATQSLYVSASGETSTARDAFSTTAAVATRVVGQTASGAPLTRGASVDVSGIASNSALLSAALSLVGMSGDCTMLVESALRLLGYQVGDLGPMGFGGYGTVFSDPSQVQPGDIMMRGGHVAIYAAPGLAVQGGIGFMSYLTSVASNPAEYVSFVRVG